MGSISNPGANVRDRISELPDSLITHILSLLEDTKEVVRTSILSTRWKNRWTCVPILRFYDDGYPDGVDHVFSCLDSTLNIQELTFCFTYIGYPPDFSRIYGWICAAIRRNVVNVTLSIDDMEEMELPQSLFTCKTLKVLNMESNFIVNPPTTGCFPSLKVLYCHLYVCDDHNSVLEKMFSNCPVLEDLTIRVFGLCNPCDINISAPEMKTLELCLYMEHEDHHEDRVAHNIYINAPKLVNFDIDMEEWSHFRFHINANSLLKASFHTYCCSYVTTEHVCRISALDAISRVKHLSHSSPCVFKVLRLPEFVNLTHLKLDATYLIEFLRGSPNLEFLVIESEYWCRDFNEFNPSTVVPDCMLTRLKIITLEKFKGRQVEMSLVKYLLKYSEVLNEMTIIKYKDLEVEEEALRTEVLTFEKGSKTCQVKVID